MGNIVENLLVVIDKLKKANKDNAMKAFSEVFSIPEDNKCEIYNKYASLFNMSSDAKRLIYSLDLKKSEKYIKTIDDTVEGFSKIDLQKSYLAMSDFNNHFDKNLITSLDFCAEMISNNIEENEIDDEKLKEISKEVEDLINEILNLQINRDIKNLCIYNLKNIKDAILNYKLFGSDSINVNIQTCLGSMMLNSKKVKNSSEKNIFEKIFKVIINIDALLNLGNNGINLITSVYDKLIN